MSKDVDETHVLRVTDQETARVVGILISGTNLICGCGCLVAANTVLTCRHVMESANLGEPLKKGQRYQGRLAGVSGSPTVDLILRSFDKNPGPHNDLACLEIVQADKLQIPDIVFAAPLRHSRKRFSVMGFPSVGDTYGRQASGVLHAADAVGLVQMDGGSSLLVQGGYSGAPVWSPDVGAFVGLVVTEYLNDRIAWCIPSRRICEFYPELQVKFRIPKMDRPTITDRETDDPNIDFFGRNDRLPGRQLLVKVRKSRKVELTYLAQKKPRGRFVTFITYPDFERNKEDAYELFSEVEECQQGWCATNWIKAGEPFTVAAVADAGETVLTYDFMEDWQKVFGV